MGQKTHPVGFRLGITKAWKSRWFSGKDYARNALEDVKIRKFIRTKAPAAGIHAIEIERSLSKVKVSIVVARPGLIIGRGGANLQLLREELAKHIGARLDLSVEEFKTPELSAQLVADDIARQIKRRLPLGRILAITADRVMAKGARGVKVVCSGVLSGPSSIARSQKIVHGSIPAQTLRANLDYAQATAFTAYGTIGVKVWIYLGEVGSEKS